MNGWVMIIIFSPHGHGAGGLALFRKEDTNLEVLASCDNFIDCKILFERKTFYATSTYADTKYMWQHLTDEALIRNETWFLTGDFNDITSNMEKDGGVSRPEGSFTQFRSFLSENDLFDLQHTGDLLSWKGKRYDHWGRCRLDRVVANSLWSEYYPKASCAYLNFEGSDHKPIVSYFEPYKRKQKTKSPPTDKNNLETSHQQAGTLENSVRRALIIWNKPNTKIVGLKLKR